MKKHLHDSEPESYDKYDLRVTGILWFAVGYAIGVATTLLLIDYGYF